MKSIHYVPPLVALIIAAAWLTYLRGSNSALEQNNLSLQKKIAESRNATVLQNERASAVAKSPKPKREKKSSEKESKPLTEFMPTASDFNELVLLNNNEGVRFNLTAACRRLETLASEMSGDELVRAYTLMASLPVDAPFRNYLESLMLNQLKKKNPEFAFSQLIAKCQNEDTGPIKMGDFNEWLARDPAAATTWYESQLATQVFDKTLDGKTPNMVPFEAAFMMSLLASDPAAAEQRMNNIPPDLRASLGAYVWDVPKENSKAFVDLLRKSMPVEEYMAILRKNSLTEYNFSYGSKSDPKNVQKNLDSLGFTPAERSTLMAQFFTEFAQGRAVSERWTMPSREKFDEQRKWIQAIDPSSADRATGFALQSYLEESKTTSAQDFVEKVAMDYHGSGAGDEILLPLVEGSANGSIPFPKDRARVMATKISDDSIREEMLQKLN
ncbi:MAG: hypothetical protein K9N23_16140 [Akkermansiaceae bacterium]|nr:hypothetical protein [Akkermansiaceae bacterium]MCF7733222.1 hypothetical protein [Akkermansiaceae bacterium]